MGYTKVFQRNAHYLGGRVPRDGDYVYFKPFSDKPCKREEYKVLPYNNTAKIVESDPCCKES